MLARKVDKNTEQVDLPNNTTFEIPSPRFDVKKEGGTGLNLTISLLLPVIIIGQITSKHRFFFLIEEFLVVQRFWNGRE